MAYTAAEGHRWIRGASGEPSDFVVARHFLWLWSQRKERGIDGTGRFLVAGNATDEILFELRTQAGSTPLVVEILLKMLDSSKNNFDGLAIVDNRLFVLPGEVLAFYRNAPSAGNGKLSIAAVSNAIRGVSRHTPEKAFNLRTRELMGRKRWVEIDPMLVQEVAQQDGWPCKKLDGIVLAQRTLLAAEPNAFVSLDSVVVTDGSVI